MQIYLLSGENFYGQIQARSGSHWALDLPVATEGGRHSPFWELWAAAGVLRSLG